MNEMEIRNELKSKICILAREELESKFVNLYMKTNYPKKDVPELFDFSIFKNLRKMQYLNKSNFDKKYLHYNFFLKLAIKNNDNDLLSYFTKLYKRLYKD